MTNPTEFFTRVRNPFREKYGSTRLCDLDISRKKAKLFANSGDPDQTPLSVASDLGLHCLPNTLFGVSGLKLVMTLITILVLRYIEHVMYLNVWSHSSSMTSRDQLE